MIPHPREAQSRTGVTDFGHLADNGHNKIPTVPQATVARANGRLDDEGGLRLNQAVLVLLGLPAPRAKRET